VTTIFHKVAFGVWWILNEHLMQSYSWLRQWTNVQNRSIFNGVGCFNL